MERKRKTAEEYCAQGDAYRRNGDFSSAMNCYLQATRLDPEGPAATAAEMLSDIMNFYCKDIYNP